VSSNNGYQHKAPRKLFPSNPWSEESRQVTTVLTGLDTLPPSINLWRHALHWFGGIGIIVLAVAVLPFLGVGGMSLYKAETPGPIKDEKLTPRITGTARVVWMSYLGITAIGILALKTVGMSWFDAVCHARG
jgi:trk system potassium uptake protein TrkH